MVEESIKKSTAWAVFEPNDANLWTKVKGMIDNYLIQKWRDGALAGAKPDQAFYVDVGLGETMTALDILEGRLIVEIGMAVVRPAEFIILRFSHKMQEVESAANLRSTMAYPLPVFHFSVDGAARRSPSPR